MTPGEELGIVAAEQDDRGEGEGIGISVVVEPWTRR